MKIVSWNINGIRSQRSNGTNPITKVIEDLKTDILCLQETKVTRELLEESLALIDGFYSFFSFSKKRSGYSGVATFCKKDVTPVYAQDGLGGSLDIGILANDSGCMEYLNGDWDANSLKNLDYEGRCIITQHKFLDEGGLEKLLSIINVYCPRADPERPERAEYKLAFYELLKQRAAALEASGSAVIILGDINTSHRRIDHCDPDDTDEFENRPDRMFLDKFILEIYRENQELDIKLQELSYNSDDINSKTADKEEVGNDVFKVIDTFRYFHPFKEGAFTCWNTQVGARSTNYGTRLDYVFCDRSFLPYVADSKIFHEYMGSDHCPVSISTQKVKFVASESVPSSCTKFYPEFHGSQQKISSYFLDRASKSNFNSSVQSNVCNKRKINNSDKVTVNLKRKNLTSKETSRPISTFFTKRNNSEKENSKADIKCLEKISSHSSLSSSNNDVPSHSELKTDLEKEIPVGPKVKEGELKSKTKSASWGFLMKSLPPPPLCSGHNEFTVLRTVKKKGDNYKKQFYCCARGQGKEGDANARCNFFKWLVR